MTRIATLLALVSLAGCQSIAVTRGDLTVETKSYFRGTVALTSDAEGNITLDADRPGISSEASGLIDSVFSGAIQATERVFGGGGAGQPIIINVPSAGTQEAE
jgi:hypothetical protein